MGFSFTPGTNILTVGSTVNTTTVTGVRGRFGQTVSAQSGNFASATAYSCHFLSSIVQSSVPSVVIPIPAGFHTYQIRISRLLPATTGGLVVLDASVNGGVSYIAGTNYYHSVFGANGTTGVVSGTNGSTGTSDIRLTSADTGGINTGLYGASIVDIKTIADRFHIGWEISFYANGTGNFVSLRGNGMMQGDANTVTHVRFRFHNGNVNTFNGALYGFRNS